GVETVLGDLRGGLGLVDELGLGHAVAPGRAFGGRHLVQGDGDGVALGVVVVAGTAVGADEGVLVVGRPRLDGGVGGAGHGEVQQDQAAGVVGQAVDGEVLR